MKQEKPSTYLTYLTSPYDVTIAYSYHGKPLQMISKVAGCAVPRRNCGEALPATYLHMRRTLSSPQKCIFSQPAQISPRAIYARCRDLAPTRPDAGRPASCQSAFFRIDRWRSSKGGSGRLPLRKRNHTKHGTTMRFFFIPTWGGGGGGGDPGNQKPNRPGSHFLHSQTVKISPPFSSLAREKESYFGQDLNRTASRGRIGRRQR